MAGVQLKHGSKVEESPNRQGPLSVKGGRGDGSAGLLLAIGPHKRKRRGGPRGEGEGRAACVREQRGERAYGQKQREGESGLQHGRPKSKEGASLFLFYISKAYFELDFEFSFF